MAQAKKDQRESDTKILDREGNDALWADKSNRKEYDLLQDIFKTNKAGYLRKYGTPYQDPTSRQKTVGKKATRKRVSTK